MRSDETYGIAHCFFCCAKSVHVEMCLLSFYFYDPLPVNFKGMILILRKMTKNYDWIGVQENIRMLSSKS